LACRGNTQLSIPWKLDHQIWSNYGIIDSDDTFLGYLPAPRIFRPTDPYQVSYAILEAENLHMTVRALGSGWSFSDAVLPQNEALTPGEQADGAKVWTKVEHLMAAHITNKERELSTVPLAGKLAASRPLPAGALETPPLH
jgi:hypothetical protein